jgi:hypothetical protein
VHAGRMFLFLRQYLDQRLAGAPAWQRAAVGTAMALLGLALAAVGVLLAHIGFIMMGAILAIAPVCQGAAAVRRKLRR